MAGLANSIRRVLELQKTYSHQNTKEMKERGVLIRHELPTLLQTNVAEYGFVPDGSDGEGRKNRVCWVRVYDGELSPNATKGWYLVYLFAADGSAVFLSLNQGTLIPKGNGDYKPVPKGVLQERVGHCRDFLQISAVDLSGLHAQIELSDPRRGLGYQRGNVYAIRYEVNAIPNDAELMADLERMMTVLQVVYKGHPEPSLESHAPPIGFSPSIAEEIQIRAKGHEIGRLQEIRKELGLVKRLAGHEIFHEDSIKDTYAFHYGGRRELQFNIGTEPGNRLRHGVAFSFEPSRTLPDPNLLLPYVKRFNDFLTVHADQFSDMMMWYWDEEEQRSTDYSPRPIEPGLLRSGVFVFMGKMQSFSTIDYDLIVEDLDRLVPLYRFTCSDVPIQSTATFTSRGFDFKPGCKTKPNKTKASVTERELNVTLRHNELQEALHDYLVGIYGKDKVGTECSCSDGRVDVVVRQKDIHWFYEIKTCLTARGCISQGLAQLLEYSYWPGSQIAERLIIVGEPKLDNESEKYLTTLRTEFGLPLEYAQFDMSSKILV